MKNVDYGSVANFVQIVKNFYQECDIVRNRTEEEVMAWRTANEVYVDGTANFKPILQFSEGTGLSNFIKFINAD